MKDLPLVATCPLGSKCREIVNDKIHVCKWLISIKGVDPQDSTKVIDNEECAIAVLPILLIETSRNVQGVQAATESFRNEMVASNKNVASLLLSDLK